MAPQDEKIAIIGAGVMGAGLAQLFAQHGHPVSLYDVSESALGAALGRARDNLELQAEMGWVDPGVVEPVIGGINATGDLGEALGGSWFVIEAVPEDLELKKKVFDQLGRLAPGDAVLASNTSTFDVMAEVDDSIADRVLITHFFNPPQLVPLVEVVRGERTSDEAVERAVRLMEEAGKTTLTLSRYAPGFVINRIQLAINSMSYMLLLEGIVGPEQIDMAIENSISLRLAVGGPFATMDLGGLDIVAAAARTMGFEPPQPLLEKVEQGELGVKAGRGFYDYAGTDEKSVLRRRDKRLMLLLEAYRRGLNA